MEARPVIKNSTVKAASRWLLGVALVAVLLLAGSTRARAQALLYGSLTGTVTDPSGAAIPGAQVTALERDTGVRQTAATNSEGIYRFTALLPGSYTVTVSAKGFESQATPNVAVQVNGIAQLNAQLKVGQASQTVTVTTAAPLLQTETAVVQTNITTRQIENLPIFGTEGANFQSLLREIPGSGLTSETNSTAGNPQRAINTNFNGQSYQAIDTRIDGVLDAYPYLPANVAYVPPEDAIQTVNVVTNSFTAQEGMAGGAEVNVEIKSGTNNFHGDGHEFHTDNNFEARNYFDTDPTLFPHINRFNQNEYGGAVGGPVLRNKLFFFFDFDRTTTRQLAGPDTRTLPTAAMATGNFAGLPGNPVIYDPATGNAAGAGKTQISCNGVPNMICPSRIDPAAETMIQLMQPLFAQEKATSNGLLNWTGSGTALFNRNNSDAKVTWVPNQNTAVWGRYSFSKTLVYDPPLLGAAIGDATNGGQLGNAPGLVQLVGMGVTHTFTPNLLFDWNAGYTRQNLGSTFDLTSPRGIDQLKIPGTNNVGAPGNPSYYYGWPGFTFTSPGDLNVGNAQVANPFQFLDDMLVTDANLSWTRGRHNFKGGFEWTHTLINHFQAQGGTFQNARGQFQFNGDATSEQGTTPTWFNEWADFLLGLPNETGKARQLFNPNAERWGNWAWYLQDQWQMNPKMTLTYGVRWEYYPFGYADNGKGLRWLNLQTGVVSIGGYGNIPRNDGVDVGIGQFLPRVGFAYNVRPNTVIRAGYGLTADPYDPYHVMLNAYPSLLLDTNLPPNTADYVPAASLTGLNGTGLGSGSYSVPTGIVLIPQPNLSSGQIALPTSASTTTVPNPYNRGYINSYNVTIEQEFGSSTAFNIGYVGAYDLRPVASVNANASAPGAGSAGGVLSQKYGANYTGGIGELLPLKDSRYDALQTSLKYRFAGGSNVSAVYTWSKAMSYADEQDLGAIFISYAPDYFKDYGPAAYDRTNNFEISAVAALPFGRGEPWLRSGIGGHILGGWLIDPVLSAMSGLPFTVTGNNSALNSNGSNQTADLVGHFKLDHGKPPRVGVTCATGDPTCSYFDPSAFAQPLITSAATAHFGNTNRDEFRGPGYFDMDLSLVRDFKVREWATLEVRGDAMGLTNTPHFGAPNAACAGSGAAPGPITTSGGLCGGNNFGVITGFVEPGGYFGTEPGNRTVYLGAEVKF
ncbi:MAG TPA: TonB-dependent receptor [Terracidiphilus sp.]|nr:TonB-dependent receptor [Terracidiphilus sp.]